MDSNIELLEIGSLSELREVLEEHMIPVEDFGTAHYKSIEKMWEEISNGEMSLAIREKELVRCASVTRVYVETEHDGEDYVLIEQVQAMLKSTDFDQTSNLPIDSIKGFKYRHTLYAVWGKIKDQEDIDVATRREISEELFGGHFENDFLLKNCGEDSELEEPMDYPGLRSFLITHSFDFFMPSEFFKPAYFETEDEKLCVFSWIPKKILDAYIQAFETQKALS